MRNLFIILTILSVLFYSCKKEQPQVNNNSTPTTSTQKYFIEGKIDGVMLRAEYTCPYSGCDESMGNYSEFLSMITMQRTVSASDKRKWDIHILDVKLDKIQIPDTIYPSNISGQEKLELN